MKKSDWRELSAKPRAEMEKLLREKRERLHARKLELAAGKVKKIQEIHELKKGIARILTLLKRDGI